MSITRADASQIQRIVLLVDLHHPLVNPDVSKPSQYFAAIISAARTLLSYPPLSSSLFATKLFLSSLSPLLSDSILNGLLGKSATSFDRPSQTLISLSSALNSLYPHRLPDHHHHHFSRTTLIAQSLFQIVHEYPWEPHIDYPSSGAVQLDVLDAPPNLVILFSPLPRSSKCFSEFLEFDVEDDAAAEVLRKKFLQVFGPIVKTFAKRNIHFSWVDINFDTARTEEQLGGSAEDANGNGLSPLFEGEIKGLGWGFCSTNAIILGSALVPFALIFPNVGCSALSKIRDNHKLGCAELSLAISDLTGQPLECKICDLELFDIKSSKGCPLDLSRIMESDSDLFQRGYDEERTFWREIGNRSTKVRVKELWKADKREMKMAGRQCDIVLLRGFSPQGRKYTKNDKTSCCSVADEVLQMLQLEGTMFHSSKPAWQLFLTFLHKECCWAKVSVSMDDCVDAAVGILSPFTVHSAILFLFIGEHELDDNTSEGQMVVGKTNMNSVRLEHVEGKRKRRNRKSNLLKGLTWSSFCKEIFSCTSEAILDPISPRIGLEAFCLSRECDISKKVKFLQCWMKQVKRCSGDQVTPNELNTVNYGTKDETQIIGSQQKVMEQSIGSFISDTGTSFTASIKDEGYLDPQLETLEVFSESISQKIEQSLNSEVVDMGILAERLLNSSIQWVSLKLEKNPGANLTSKKVEIDHTTMIDNVVEKLLLKKPKDLAAKYKGCGPSIKSTLNCDASTSERKVKEYELQILFRMEILRSKIGSRIEEPAKQMMIKEICLLLENIEFNLQGGLFGGESLVEFAGRTIKKRYSCSLEDIIHRIYTQMEFFSLDDAGANSFLNNDLHDVERPKEVTKNLSDAFGGNKGDSGNMDNASAESTPSFQLEENTENTQIVIDIVHEQDIMEARQRRERAQRFSSFASPRDLQRVWAPKQPKVARIKSESRWKTLERKEKRGNRKEVVCETPLVGIKHARAPEGEGQCTKKGATESVGSISKALFFSNEGLAARDLIS